LREPVCQCDRQRHQLGRLTTSEADHHALIACALQLERIVLESAFPFLQRVIHAGCYVRRLLLEINLDQRMVRVETDLFRVVADVANRVPNRALDVELRMSGHLSDHDAQSLGDRCLTGDARVRVLRQHPVEYGVGDLIANLVGVTLRDRFGGHEERARAAKGSCHNGCQS